MLQTPPSGEVLQLAEVKLHLRVDGTADDDLITALIIAARQMIEGPDGVLGGVALMPQTWDWSFDDFCAHDGRRRHLPAGLDRFPRLRMPLAPVRSVTSVKYYDANGTQQTIDPSLYQTGIDGARTILAPSPDRLWPVPQYRRLDAVTVRFVAGYDDADKVPKPIRQAMLLAIGALYENRDGAGAGLPAAAQSLLFPLRLF